MEIGRLQTNSAATLAEIQPVRVVKTREQGTGSRLV